MMHSLDEMATHAQSASDAASNRVPPMDEAAFHGVVGEVVRAIEPETEADPAAILVQFLVAVGSIIGRESGFCVDGAKHGLNLFAVIVGVSGKGRKGTSWAQTKQIFHGVDSEWTQKQIVSGGLSSGEGLIFAVRDPIITKQPIKKSGNPTGEYVEVITDFGIEDKRLLVVESEFSSVLKVMGRDGNTLSAILRAAWDSGDLRIITKNNPVMATNAHISIIGHITGEELKRYLDQTETANGFGNRFLWVCSQRSKYLPDGGKPIDLAPYTDRIRRAVQFARQKRIMGRDEEASDLWHSIYTDLSEGSPGLFGALTGRAEAQVLRIAAIYALLDCSPQIRFVHLHAALAVWEYCENSVRFIFGSTLGDPIADTILTALKRAPAGLARTAISQLFQRNQKAARIQAALQLLAEAGYARSQSQDSDGRPVEVWFAVEKRN